MTKTVLLGAALLAAAFAPAAPAATSQCRNLEQITHVTASGVACSTARHVVLAYERAVTSTRAGHVLRRGKCFGRLSLPGPGCVVAYRTRHYVCRIDFARRLRCHSGSATIRARL